LYDSRETYLNNAQNFVWSLNLSRDYYTSEIKRKNYSLVPTKIIDFYTFSIFTNGALGPYRLIKLGLMNENDALNLLQTIRQCTGN
jgi:hypothetical protein